MKNLRIFVACDASSRDALRHAVQSGAGSTVCGDASDPFLVMRGIREHRPDILLMEIGTCQPAVLDVIRQARDVVQQLEVGVCVSGPADRVVRDGWLSGARGFILKESARQQINPLLGALTEHKSYIQAEIAVQVLPTFLNSAGGMSPEPKIHHLTSREKQIVQLVASGRTSKEIAAALALSPKTVEAHRASILKKLNIRSASQMVLHAVRNNIISA